MANTKVNSNLYLITSTFPYGSGESFVYNELKVLSGHFKNIHVLPLSNTGEIKFNLPGNVIVSNTLFIPSSDKKKLRNVFITNLGLIIRIFFIELLKNKGKRKFILGKKKEMAILICSTIQRSENLHKYISSCDGPVIFYSFWMNDGALILSILKYRKLIDSFIFRVHGFDLYDERKEKRYMPFRYFIMSQAGKVFTACEYASQYLISKSIFSEKVKMSHLGTFDHGPGPFIAESGFTLVSCSNLWPIKGIDKIIDILKQLDFELNWYHFGKGPLLEELKLMAQKLPSNIHWEFKGQYENSELMEFYRQNQVNLFISMSETEGGVPVSMQEAASFGIPLMGTRVGGIPEIVKNETGILLPEIPDTIEAAGLIKRFRTGEMNTEKFREKVREYWKKNFNAEINYVHFLNEITKIN